MVLQPEPDSCVRNKRPYKEKKVSRTFTVFTCVWNFASSVNRFMVDFIAQGRTFRAHGKGPKLF